MGIRHNIFSHSRSIFSALALSAFLVAPIAQAQVEVQPIDLPTIQSRNLPVYGMSPKLQYERFFRITVLEEVLATSRFLQRNTGGLPYTPDSRVLNNYPEEVRLLIVTQALGYMNLYTISHSPQYRQEATKRLDYILSQGDRVLHHSNFDGQLGYAYLRAYSLFADERYKSEGLRIAGTCVSAEHNNMNGGYMCAMALGQAYTITGNPIYLSASRAVTRNTGDKQFPNGAFPHRDSLLYGENTSYTAWMINEMLIHRRDDRQNPDMDHAILNAARFLEQRVNADGSINYEDSAGSYYDDPDNMDSRGWMMDPAYIAVVLHAVGKDAAAKRTLEFLFRQQGTGVMRGSYPDKWAYIEAGNIWQTGDPSMIRTSLIFWMITSLLQPPDGAQCTSGTVTPCVVTPTDCHPALRELGLCDQGLTGAHSCIQGVATACLNERQIIYKPDLCYVQLACSYSEDMDSSQTYVCTNIESRKCVGSSCSSWCTNASRVEPTCVRDFAQGNICLDPPFAGGSVAANPLVSMMTLQSGPRQCMTMGLD